MVRKKVVNSLCPSRGDVLLSKQQNARQQLAVCVRPASRGVKVMLCCTAPLNWSIWRSFLLKDHQEFLKVTTRSSSNLWSTPGHVHSRRRFSVRRMPCTSCACLSSALLHTIHFYITCFSEQSSSVNRRWHEQAVAFWLYLIIRGRLPCPNYTTKCPLHMKHCCFHLIWRDFC